MAATYHHLIGRLCYTSSIFKPFVPPGSSEEKAKWGATLLIAKADVENDPAFKAYQQDILDTGQREFNSPPSGYRISALKNGDAADEEFKHGFWVVKADSKWAFKVIGPDNSEIAGGSPTADQMVYDGQHVMFRIKLDAWTYMTNRGVAARLQGIKVLGGGKRESYTGGDSSAAMAAVDVALPPSMIAAEKAAAEDARKALAGEDDSADPFGDPAPAAPQTFNESKKDEEIPW